MRIFALAAIVATTLALHMKEQPEGTGPPEGTEQPDDTFDDTFEGEDQGGRTEDCDEYGCSWEECWDFDGELYCDYGGHTIDEGGEGGDWWECYGEYCRGGTWTKIEDGWEWEGCEELPEDADWEPMCAHGWHTDYEHETGGGWEDCVQEGDGDMYCEGGSHDFWEDGFSEFNYSGPDCSWGTDCDMDGCNDWDNCEDEGDLSGLDSGDEWSDCEGTECEDDFDYDEGTGGETE